MSTVTPSKPAPPRPRPARTGPSAPSARGPNIDPFRLIRRHLLGIIASVFVGVGVGVGAFILLNHYYPLYSGEVLFEVRPGVADAGEVGTQTTLNADDIERTANTQIVLLTSREVLRSAMGDPDVQNKTNWFQADFMEGGTPLVETAVDELVEDLRAGLVRGTELFSLEWSAHEALDVPIVLNSISRAYMAKRMSLDNQLHNENLELFKGQLGETNLNIRDLDQEIEDFIELADITSLIDPRYHETSIAVNNFVNQITEAKQLLSVSRSRLQQTAAKLEGTMQPSSEDTLQAEQDYSVTPHVQMVQSAKFNLRVLRERYRGDHAAVHEAESQLRAAEAEMKARIDEVVRRNLNAQLKIYLSEVQSYQQMLDELEQEVEDKGKQLNELAGQTSRYEAMKSQREYLETARDADRQLIREIQLMRARTDAERVGIAQYCPTPRERSFPKAEVIIPLGVVLVLGLTIGSLFLREITDQRVKSASDLAIIPGARVLGVIPDLDDDPTKCREAELVIRKSPTSVLAESYRQVCTPITEAFERSGHQTLVLIGGLPGAGTTTAASNLAIGFAAMGRSVLLVDANFRRPRLGKVMGLEPDRVGLGDLLTGAATLDEAVAETESGVGVIAAGTPGTRVIERLSTDEFDGVLAELRARYDIVIFDAPPAVVAGDATVLANKVDAAVLVVRAHQEQRGLVARLMSRLADSQCELIGIMLNRPRGTAGGYFKKNFAVMAEYAKAPA